MIKKLLVVSFIAAACYACGGGDQKAGGASKDSTAAPAAADLSSNPDYQKGLALIATTDCLTCHKVDETSTGPAYRDVANKYSNDDKTIATLADKIIKGGTGNWGSAPMTPHPNLPVEDAKQIVKYILLLKNK